MRQIPLALVGAPEPDFDHFVVGANALVLAALRTPAPGAAPVYLWGGPGCGKSHLLAALARQVRQQGGRCGCFSAAQPVPWTFDEGWSLIVIDDADRLDEAQQHAAFRLFIEAASHGTWVVSAGACPPVDLPVREDLRSRFGWGPVHQVQPLGDADLAQALHAEAQRRQIPLNAELLSYLQTRFARDLRSLKQLLERLDDFSLAERRAMTVPLLKKMLADEHEIP